MCWDFRLPVSWWSLRVTWNVQRSVLRCLRGIDLPPFPLHLSQLKITFPTNSVLTFFCLSVASSCSINQTINQQQMLWARGGAENCAEQPEVSRGPGREGRLADQEHLWQIIHYINPWNLFTTVLYIFLTLAFVCDHSTLRRRTSTRRRSRFLQTSWRRWVNIL